MTSALLILAAGLLLLAAAAVDHAPRIGRRVVLSARGGWRPRGLASRPPAPDEPPAVGLVGGHPERGDDHNDATEEEVLAVFDELAAQTYYRVVAFEDDVEVPLPPQRIEGPQRASDPSPWSTPPARRLVLVRWPVTS